MNELADHRVWIRLPSGRRLNVSNQAQREKCGGVQRAHAWCRQSMIPANDTGREIGWAAGTRNERRSANN